jgi:hypothetical protein
MTATFSPSLRTPAVARRTFAGLAVHELRRFVVNPLFLLGAALTTLIWNFPGSAPIVEINESNPFTAIILGGFSMMAAFWQTRSLRPSSQVVEATPVPLPMRSAALCSVAIVPLLCGIASLLIFRHTVVVAGDWVYGAFDPPARTAVLVSQFVLPALGGPLLGVALGRWVQFPGAGFVLLLLLYGWVCLVTLPSVVRSPDQTSAVALRFFSPFAFFTVHSDAGGVTTWRGSPWFFIGWQLALCVVAVLLALLKGAEGHARRRILRALWIALIAAGLLLTLTVQGGFPHAVTTP